MFFHVDGIRDMRDFVSRLSNDPVTFGANKVNAEHRDGWHIVSADIDCLPDQIQGGAAAPNPAFKKTTPFIAPDLNSFHYAVFVTALARMAVTKSIESQHVLAGAVPDDHDIWQHVLPSAMARSVAFTLDPNLFAA